MMLMTMMHMHYARLDRRSVYTPLTFHERKSLNKQSGLRCYKALIFRQIRQMGRGGFLSFIRTCDGL